MPEEIKKTTDNEELDQEIKLREDAEKAETLPTLILALNSGKSEEYLIGKGFAVEDVSQAKIVRDQIMGKEKTEESTPVVPEIKTEAIDPEIEKQKKIDQIFEMLSNRVEERKQEDLLLQKLTKQLEQFELAEAKARQESEIKTKEELTAKETSRETPRENAIPISNAEEIAEKPTIKNKVVSFLEGLSEGEEFKIRDNWGNLAENEEDGGVDDNEEEDHKEYNPTPEVKTERKITSKDIKNELDILEDELDAINWQKLGWWFGARGKKSKEVQRKIMEYHRAKAKEDKEAEYKDKYEIDPNTSEHIQNMRRIQNEYERMHYEWKKKYEQLKEQAKGNENRTEILRDERIKYYSLQEQSEEKFEAESSKEFPLAYYAVNKITDPEVKILLTKISATTGERFISLQDIDDEDIDDPIMYSEKGGYGEVLRNRHIAEVDKNCIEYNIYGFSLRILNLEELPLKDGEFKLRDKKAKYNVYDPDGNILIENVDYDKGDAIYDQATEKYAEKIKEEYNNIHKE